MSTSIDGSTLLPFFTRKRIENPDSISGRVQREVHARYLSKRAQNVIPSDGELQDLSTALSDCSPAVAGLQFVTYDQLRTIAKSKSLPRSLRSFFSASAFLSLPRDAEERVSLAAFFSFLVDSVNLQQTQLLLGECDELGTGFLTEAQVQTYVGKTAMPYLENYLGSSGWKGEDFLKFYAVTISRRFMIELDLNGIGKIAIHTLFMSDIFLDYQYTLKNPNSTGKGLDAASAMRLYQNYAGLDTDADGMLSRTDLAGFAGGAISPVIVSRAFEEMQSFGRQLDYKGYLDFAIVMENKGKPHSVKYLFTLLDIAKKKYLTRADLLYQIHAVLSNVYERRPDLNRINPHDMADEIFDMITPVCSKSITLKDLLNSKAAAVVLGLLTDANDLYHYENRENYLHANNTSN